MGVVKEVIEDKLISPIPDRNANRIYVYKKPNGEVSIWFRNLKLTLIGEEIEEWTKGFKEALDNFNKSNYFKDDI